ncbi:hypothetical protein [Serratia fonticola]|uniref:Uncharacterized protein n=1 Tax=Serratia fonticola TaxID=47917 RepID=A0ABY9PT85_SERFO|nr:hypothetical protein [Serratia fonticola]WMT16660.1 hypothetical protein RFB13_10195 [Serratia fonticola]
MKMKLALVLFTAVFATNTMAASAIPGLQWADHNLNSCISMLTSSNVPQQDKDILVKQGGTCSMTVDFLEKVLIADNFSIQSNEKELAKLMKKVQPYLDNGFDNKGMKLWNNYSAIDRDNKELLQITQVRTSKIAIIKPYIK